MSRSTKEQRQLTKYARLNAYVRYPTWSPKGDAIVYEDGSPVEPPIAACEEQAFVHVAKLHLSEVLWWLGEKDLAKRLHHEAEELKKRFADAFWMEDEGFTAMALDAQGRPVRSVGSNGGHCVAAGILDRALVPRAAECSNLLVPVCLSASHISYGSIRMEPVFMVLGQSAATAAALAIADDVAVHLDCHLGGDQIATEPGVLAEERRHDSSIGRRTPRSRATVTASS